MRNFPRQAPEEIQNHSVVLARAGVLVLNQYIDTEIMHTIIVEVSGGVVQEVYSDVPNLRVILVDWDKGDRPGDEYAGGVLKTCSLDDLPSETRAAVSELAI